jgi:hypothetical protein
MIELCVYPEGDPANTGSIQVKLSSEKVDLVRKEHRDVPNGAGDLAAHLQSWSAIGRDPLGQA